MNLSSYLSAHRFLIESIESSVQWEQSRSWRDQWAGRAFYSTEAAGGYDTLRPKFVHQTKQALSEKIKHWAKLRLLLHRRYSRIQLVTSSETWGPTETTVNLGSRVTGFSERTNRLNKPWSDFIRAFVTVTDWRAQVIQKCVLLRRGSVKNCIKLNAECLKHWMHALTGFTSLVI